MFEDRVRTFASLRTDKNRKRWSPLTRHQAPHKPFLLLSIIDLIARGQITSPIIEPSFELIDTFNGYYALVMPPSRRGLPSYPLYHLRSEPFWQLIPQKGQTDRAGRTISSIAKFTEYYAGARIDAGLFTVMTDPARREILRKTLVETYFDESIQPLVADQGVVNLVAYAYAKELTGGVHETVAPPPYDDENVGKRIRDQGFRRAIVQLYDHRCALCGIRMMTPEGHTVVEAAHIKPWSKSFDDRPTNGLCLCRLCHWSFDEGLMGVGKQYEVLVSRKVRSDRNYLGHIQSLIGREIIRPTDEVHTPAQENLDWHRRHVYG
jgi:putative restriction endonuclease